MYRQTDRQKEEARIERETDIDRKGRTVQINRDRQREGQGYKARQIEKGTERIVQTNRDRERM